MLLLLPRIPD